MAALLFLNRTFVCASIYRIYTYVDISIYIYICIYIYAYYVHTHTHTHDLFTDCTTDTPGICAREHTQSKSAGEIHHEGTMGPRAPK